MLTNPTLERLRLMRLHGMADAYAEQGSSREANALSFDERLGLLVDREHADRESRKLTNRLRNARFKVPACIEDLDYSPARGLDKTQIRGLARSSWIREHQNILIVGATGTGKTYLACAFAHKACLEGFTARYERLSRLLDSVQIARLDGNYPKLIAQLAKTDVLILDDWGLAQVKGASRNDLLEILDDRHGQKSTIVTSQLPVAEWHAAIGEQTLADAILDRIVHNGHRIILKGDSMRKKLAKTNESGHPKT